MGSLESKCQNGYGAFPKTLHPLVVPPLGSASGQWMVVVKQLSSLVGPWVVVVELVVGTSLAWRNVDLLKTTPIEGDPIHHQWSQT